MRFATSSRRSSVHLSIYQSVRRSVPGRSIRSVFTYVGLFWLFFIFSSRFPLFCRVTTSVCVRRSPRHTCSQPTLNFLCIRAHCKSARVLLFHRHRSSESNLLRTFVVFPTPHLTSHPESDELCQRVSCRDHRELCFPQELHPLSVVNTHR